MNILPKKSWHVRTKDNIARVRRDEAAAAEEERKTQGKLELAESEARINFLRKKCGLPEKINESSHTSEQPQEDEPSSSSSQHVNLFADYKTHVKTTNKELEKEKKEEQEKYEKQIGYLTYLGQDTNEALRLKSWYEKAPNRTEVGADDRQFVEKDMKTKYNHDPLTLINALLPPEPKIESKSPTKRKMSVTQPATDILTEITSKKHKKERKKHKKEKHKNHKHSKKKKGKSKDREKEATQKLLKLEQLRKERLKRETAERVRQEALLAPKETNKQVESVPQTPRVVQKYNSQFNPELAKQNMN